LKAIIRSFGTPFILSSFQKVFSLISVNEENWSFKKLISDIALFVGPLLLSQVIEFLSNPDEPWYLGVIYALAMFLAACIQSLSLTQVSPLEFFLC
jgi:hypothetical protein